ncbi:MAG TPA: ribose-phosphate diphosphokinase [Chromatiaceae bacterium]|nr:ribose-phosphate diphosphokinase [Chromatiaceae bacterium]
MTLLLGFPEYREPTERLAMALDLPFDLIAIHRFPDGESLIRTPTTLPEKVILCRSLHFPNEKLVELLLVIAHLREQGVKRILLVAPYLSYMRQDKAFHPGEVVSQRVLGRLLASHIDGILTVDAHLHRIHRLEDAIPVDPAVNLTATEPMAEFLEKARNRPLLVGPDEESEQWVASIAAHEALDYLVARKRRLGDQQVEIRLPAYPFAGREIVLVDDVASTGHTLEKTAMALAAHAPASVSVLVTHALFVGNAMQRLSKAGIEHIWSCDSIPHPTNRISLCRLLADELRKLIWE